MLDRFAMQRIAEHPHDRGNHRQRHSQPDVGVNDHLGFVGPILVERRARQGGGADAGQAAEDQRRSDAREDGRAEAVERLGEGQPAMHGLRRSKQADQRIGDDLDDDHAAGEDEQGQQEQAVGRGLRRRDEQQAADHHRQQPRHRAAHIADFLDQLRTGNADHEIGGEEAELDQHRLGVVEREQLLEPGNDHVIEAGDAAEDEEQRHHEIAQVGRFDVTGSGRPRHVIRRVRHSRRGHCHSSSSLRRGTDLEFGRLVRQRGCNRFPQ